MKELTKEVVQRRKAKRTSSIMMVNRVLKQIGVDSDQNWITKRDIRSYAFDPLEERSRYHQLADLIMACAVVNLKQGNWKCGMDILEMIGVYTPKLEIQAVERKKTDAELLEEIKQVLAKIPEAEVVKTKRLEAQG